MRILRQAFAYVRLACFAVRAWFGYQLFAVELGRNLSRLGLGTAWLYWMASRSPYATRPLRLCLRDHRRDGDLDPVDLHRSLVSSYRIAMSMVHVADVEQELFLRSVAREAMRREQDRILPWQEPDETDRLVRVFGEVATRRGEP